MAMVSAVYVPRSEKRSGTTTKRVEAGVTQESVSRVPPTTPMERLSFCGVGPVAGASAWGALSVSVIESGSDQQVRGLSAGAVSPPDEV